MGTYQNKIVTQLDFVTGSQVGLKELEVLLNKLKTEAQAVTTSLGGSSMEKDFQKAISAAEQLQKIVAQSTNVKLGKIDFAEVTSQINKTYGSMEKLQQQLHRGGAHGDRIFNSFNNSLLRTNLQLKESNRLIDEMATSFGNTVKWGISSSVFNSLTGSLSKAWDYAKHLDTSLNDIRIVTGKSADEMERFAKIANESAKSLGASTLDYTEAALIYYQQGDTDEVARAKADVTLKAANVTGQSGQEVSEQLTAVWNGYKVSAEEAELYIDKLAAVAASTASDLEELSTGMSKVASAASIMGVDIDQLNATLATVVSVTRQAPESVGTAFKTIYSRMGDIEAGLDAETTLGSYTEKIKEIAGVNVLDTNGQLRDMGEVIEEVGEKWHTLSREQQIALSQTMAGTRQYNNLLALFDNWDMYTSALNTSAQAAGTLQKQQDIYMESTEAHLQKLETEWERLYNEIFDQETANGFIDVLTLGLATIGDYIEGLGGGLNALLNMGAGVGQIFSKNIAKSLTTSYFNRQTQKDNEAQMKEYLANAENKVRSENLSEGENAIEEKNLERAKQLLSISKYLTSEEFQQLNTQRDEIRALELKIQKTKELKQAGSTASLEKAKAQSLKEEASSIIEQIEEVQFAWEGIKNATDGVAPGDQDLQAITEFATEIQNIAGQFSQKDDVFNIYGKGLDWEGALKPQKELLKDMDRAVQGTIEGKKKIHLTDEQINALLTVQKAALQNIETEQRERLNNAQLLEDTENNIYETQLKQTELEAQDFDKKINIKQKENQTQQNVEALMLSIQAITALVGGLGVLSDEESTGAEKANASWSMLATTASSVGTLIGGPVAGMITSGVVGIIKAGLEATGVWEGFEDLFKSTAEKLDEVNKEVQEFNEEIAKGKSEHKANKDSIKELEEIQSRFEYLQRLAQKGLLTDKQQTEYENHLSTIKKYNEDIVITYTAQGNMITSNNNALQQTIDRLKEINDIKLSEVYTQDSWDKTTEALEEQHELEIEQRKKDKKDYQTKVDSYGNPWHDGNNGDLRNSYIGDLTGLPGYDEINNYLKDKNDAIRFYGTVPGTNPVMSLDELYSWNPNTGEMYIEEQLDIFKYNINELKKKYPEIQDALQQYYEDVYNQFLYREEDEDGAVGIGPGVIKRKHEAMQKKVAEEFKDPKAVVDYDLIINTLKYNNLDKGKYDRLKELGISNLDGLLDSYLQGLDFSSKQFTTDGHIDYDKIKKHILDMESKLATLFATSPDLLELSNKIRNKNKTGLSSEKYEKEQIEEIEKFLAGLSQDEFEDIEKYLPALFGVHSVSAQWDAKQGKATLGKNGGNIVTSGEQQARTIGKILSESYVGDESQKKGFTEGIEQYLQENLDEVELSNLDTEKFSTDFNNLLFNALNDDGTFKKGMSLEKVINQAIANQSGIEDAKLTDALYKHLDDIEAEDLDFEEYKVYTKHIMEMADESDILADSLEDDAVAAAAVAESTMRMNKGVEVLSENFEEWNSILKNSDKSSEEYCEALNDMRDAIADVLDVEEEAIDSDFITSHLELIAKAAQGNAEAIDQLRDAYADRILLNISADNLLEDSEIQSLKDRLNSLQNEMPNFEVGRIDDAEFIKSCEQLIADAGMTAEQANKMFSAMGIEPEYETTEDTVEVKKPVTRTITVNNSRVDPLPDGLGGVPITDTRTFSYIDGYVPIKETILKVAMGVNGKTPKITGLTKKATGTMNNTSSINKGGKSSGSGSKPQKIKKTEANKDRYHDVNVKLKQISNSLDEVQQQTELLTGQSYIDNLAKQYGLLNKEIETTAEKIKIAKDEQAELQAELAGQGITFNSDGTIANYFTAYDTQLAKLHAVEDRYNSMSATQQEKYQETYDKAKEDWDKFLETISRYDELLTDEIPGLEDSIREANLEQIELKLDAFHYEIELRLDMAEAERDWNEFFNKVIKDIDKEDILGNAEAKLEDFMSYYKDNMEGVIQDNTQHIQDILSDLKVIDAGKDGKYYSENGVNDRAKALEDLKNYYEQLMKDLEAVHDLSDEIHESYVDMIDEAQEKFDEQIETFETINDLIEHDKNVISMIYGEEAYSSLSQFYDRQEENYNKQLDFQKQQVEFWRMQMATAEEGSDAWNAAKENWLSAVDEWNSAVETAIKNLQDKYLNAINAIFQNLNNNVTGGMGLDYVKSEWDLINQNADQYLDTVNAIYKVQELQNKYLDAIDNTDSPTQQKKLNDLMKQETDYLREQDKLSEYDLERANLKYELALKQMALEEAQQNKTQLRLRRDSQGNYTYQYTQDDDQVASIQSEIADLYNQLYNLDAEQYRGNLEEIYDIWNEFQERMAEAAQINDPEQRAAKELLIKQQYSDLINGLVEKNENLQANLYQSTMSHLFDLYNQNTANYADMSEDQKAILDMFINAETDLTGAAFDNMFDLYNINIEQFKNMTDEQQDILMSSMIPQWNSGVQQMTDRIAGEGGFIPTCKDAFEELDQATQDYMTGLEELQKNADVSFEDVKDGIDNVITETEKLLKNNDELITQYETELEAIQSVIDELDDLIKKYEDAEEAARKATEEAYKYWQETQRGNADVDPNLDKPEEDKPQPVNEPAPTNNKSAEAPKPSLNTGSYVDVKAGTRWYADSYGGGSSGIARGGKIAYINSRGSHPYNIGGLGWIKKSDIVGYDTGGYTGDWASNNGRLAMLHQKELVLNANDTANMLNAITILRDITANLGATLLNKMAAISAGNTDSIGQGLAAAGMEQNVVINAEFPNATNSREIEDALNNLVNRASQHIQKNR